jgi:hypothetical protein
MLAAHAPVDRVLSGDAAPIGDAGLGVHGADANPDSGPQCAIFDYDP